MIDVADENDAVQIDESRTNNGRRSNRQHRAQESVVRQRTLIIGDSILKGIDKRGLNRVVDVKCLRGGTVNDVAKTIRELNMDVYRQVVLYVGGNDVADGEDVLTIYRKMKSLIRNMPRDCEIYICSLCPRADVDVTAVNDTLHQLSEDMNIKVIEVYSAFTFGNGQTVYNYYLRDNTHLSQRGTSSLLRTINHVVMIMTNMRGNSGESRGPRRSVDHSGYKQSYGNRNRYHGNINRNNNRRFTGHSDRFDNEHNYNRRQNCDSY